MIGRGADLLDTSQAGWLALRGGLVRSIGYAVGIVLSLASAPLLIRHLGVIGFGEYVTALSIVTLVSGLTEAGLNAIVLREYATRTGADRDQLMRDALGLRIAMSVIGVAVAVGFTQVAGYGATLVLGVALAGIGLVLQLMQSMMSVPLQSQLMLSKAALVDFVRQFAAVLLIVALVLTGRGLIALLAVAIPASAVSLALTALLVRDMTPLRPAFNPRALLPLLRASVPYAAAIAVNVVYFRVAVVLTSLLASKLQTGYFATSFRIVEVLVGVPALAIGAAFPILARSERSDRLRFEYAAGRIFELAVLVGTWVVVVVEVGAPFAIHVLAGNQSDPSIEVLRIQVVAILATFVTVACSFPLLSMRRYRDLLLANVVALATTTALVGLLVVPFGARGAAMAAAAGEVGLALVVGTVLIRAQPALRSALRVLPAAIAAGAVACLAGVLAPIASPLQAVLAALTYVAALRLAGRLPPEAGELLRALRRPAGR